LRRYCLELTNKDDEEKAIAYGCLTNIIFVYPTIVSNVPVFDFD
jgi:hypothetical protein